MQDRALAAYAKEGHDIDRDIFKYSVMRLWPKPIGLKLFRHRQTVLR
jgi:hypothetical protein